MHKQCIVTILLLVCAQGCGRRATEPADVSELYRDLSSTGESPEDNWTAALEPRKFDFPADHAAHEDFRIEWWYFTGNVATADGRRFGYQLTFFRTGLNKAPENPSQWTVRDLYTAHFAISDLQNAEHHCFQRNSRRGIGQAGAATDQYEVWNGDWKVSLENGAHRLRATDSKIELDLLLSPTKPPVLHGREGLSQKGAAAGNASYYYSFTRLTTEGTIRIGDESFAVKGNSWMDHEFSTSFLEPGQRGWDWFAIQLDDGVDLMLYRMRRDDGSTDPFSSGSLVDGDGHVTHLSAGDFRLTPARDWKSTETGGNYPLEWNIEIQSAGYRLKITPAFDRQEMTTSATTGIVYWEGAIVVEGVKEAVAIGGRGYMELTGYAGQGLGSLIDR